MKILVTDDEREIRTVLRLLLENGGYEVIEAENGARALEILRGERGIDLCIMDIMMPRMSGVEATRKIREFSAIPILFLTAKSLDRDKEIAYTSGGDDYIVKPFSSRELLMKVEALTRRYNSYSNKSEDNPEILKLPLSVTVNLGTRCVKKGECEIDVRDKELEVLIFLGQNRGRAISTDEIYEGVWGEMPLSSSGNTVTVHILNLRRKLEDNPSAPRLIRTVWGKGYQID